MRCQIENADSTVFIYESWQFVLSLVKFTTSEKEKEMREHQI